MAAMPDTTRSFIAIAVPEPLNRQIAVLQAALSPLVSGCRWTSGLPFHATLAFLGDVPSRDLNDLCSVIAASTALFEPFEVHLEGLGAFPSANNPRVLWAGLTAPKFEPFLALRTAIVRAALQAGYRVDDPRFHPHVTLGRIKPDRGGPSDLTGLLERYRGWSGGGFTVDDIVTFASTLRPTGPHYTPIGRAPLARKNTEAPP
jgi:2'-5' RNA ligase